MCSSQLTMTGASETETKANCLRLGVLASLARHRLALKQAVESAGFHVAIQLRASDLQQADIADVDAWIVTMDSEDDDVFEAVHEWLEHIALPVIVDHELGEGNLLELNEDWQKRLRKKLQRLPGIVNLHHNERASPEQTWVLAASTGGPEAIAQFLQVLPGELNISFIYVQHIDESFDRTLAKVVERNSCYPAYLVADGSILKNNAIGILSPRQQVQFCEDGTAILMDEPWLGPYQPSVDAVVANIARLHQSIAGVIIFSGMGDDGAAACRLMRQQGGQVWVQSPDTCTVDSMPVSALETGCVDYQGTPEQLAKRLGFWRIQNK